MKGRISAVVAAGLMLTLCSAVSMAAPRMNYARLEQLFLQGQYSSVVSGADALISAGYGPKEEIYYLKGLSELKLNKFADARSSFGWIASKPGRGRKAFDANLGIGDSYMLAGQLNDAVGIYVGMLDAFRSDKNLPVVYARLASCYKALGVRDKAEYYAAMASRAAPLSLEMKTAPEAVAVARPSAPRPASPPPDMQSKAGAAGTQLTVQVGSFKNRRNAERLAKKLAAAGYDSRIEIPVGEMEKLYRVKVGRASSRSEAEALRASLEAAGYATKICDGETCE